MERVRAATRARHYSRRTEDAYVHWIRRFIVFHGKRHPRELGALEIGTFLEWLAVGRRVSASTQNQALCAVLFLYRDVLRMDVGAVVAAVPRARTPTKVPTVLSAAEFRSVLAELTGVSRLVASLLYGAGLRLQEALDHRVKDVDFERREITVRRGKGQKDRRVMLPETLRGALRDHLDTVKRLHQDDTAAGLGRVALPEALDRKFPSAGAEWRWQFVFPAGRICRDQRFGPPSRYHLHELVVQRAVTEAARRADSRSGSGVTRSGIHSRRTCSKAARTYGPCRNCLGMPT